MAKRKRTDGQTTIYNKKKKKNIHKKLMSNTNLTKNRVNTGAPEG